MSKLFQSEIENLKEILDTVKNFVMSNNKSINVTHYYMSIGDKNLLQVIEETLSDSLVDEKQKETQLNLMEIFLEKTKNLYSQISSLNDPQSIELKRRIEEGLKYFGFTGNNENDLFLLELEKTLEKLQKKEIIL